LILAPKRAGILAARIRRAGDLLERTHPCARRRCSAGCDLAAVSGIAIAVEIGGAEI
jgi:hypothetical protein